MNNSRDYLVEQLESIPAFRALLRGVMDLGLAIVSFTENKKQLNQAFMDLTEQGVP